MSEEHSQGDRQDNLGGGTQSAQASDTGDTADNAPTAGTGNGAEAAQFDNLEQSSTRPDPMGWDLQMLQDIPVTLSVEVGRSAISINNLLQLNQGSVVELDRNAGEALDVMVNGCLVAHGEVVVVNDKFGIRLTDVVSPSERVKKLN